MQIIKKKYTPGKHNFKIVSMNPSDDGRCVNCDAKEFCGTSKTYLICKCDMNQHYVNVNKERKEKLKKLNENFQER